MYYVMQQLTLPYALCTDVRECDAHTHRLFHFTIVHNYWFASVALVCKERTLHLLDPLGQVALELLSALHLSKETQKLQAVSHT